jgi:hypothetical protein
MKIASSISKSRTPLLDKIRQKHLQTTNSRLPESGHNTVMK